MFQSGNLWLAAVNLIIWTGMFLYLLSLERKIGRRETDRQEIDRQEIDRQERDDER